MTFIEMIVEARAGRDMTQKEFAEALGFRWPFRWQTRPDNRVTP